jgi:hypothetical protein
MNSPSLAATASASRSGGAAAKKDSGFSSAATIADRSMDGWMRVIEQNEGAGSI